MEEINKEWIKEDIEVKIDKPYPNFVGKEYKALQTATTTDLTREKQKDWYGDYHRQKQGITTGGLYYYILDETYIKQCSEKGQIVVPPTDAIVSVNMIPYYRYSGMTGVYLDFDTVRFPVSSTINLGEASVCRVTEVIKPEATLGTIKRYDTSQYQQAGGKFNWKKETKLQHYPYSYLEVNDHVSNPLQVIPQFFPNSSNTVSLNIRQHLNNLGMYQLYVEGYKGNQNGLNEGVITQDLSLPTTSNAYMDYMSRNQNQFKQNRFNSMVNIGTNTVSGIAGIFSLNAGGNVGSAISGVVQSSLEIANSYAQERDLKNSPATLRNTGGETLFNYQSADKNLYLYRYRIQDWECERIAWFWHQFGYKQNKVMKPNLKSRHYYNYIKTIEANVTASGIAKEHLEQIKQIFNQGVRIWHVSNEGVTIGDYTMDNKEV